MRTLGKIVLLCIVTAILPGCTLQYPIVGIAKNYNEVPRGTVTANPWTGHAFVDVQALVTKVRCAGSARVTYAPATGSVSGQMGAGVLNCEDGRAVQASYTITGLAGGFGTGRDQFGNEFTFSFGMPEDEAAATTNNYLTTASTKPPLPTTQPKSTGPEKSVKQENPSQTAGEPKIVHRPVSAKSSWLFLVLDFSLTAVALLSPTLMLLSPAREVFSQLLRVRIRP